MCHVDFRVVFYPVIFYTYTVIQNKFQTSGLLWQRIKTSSQRFRHPNIVGCLHIKKARSRQDTPPPHHATPLVNRSIVVESAIYMGNKLLQLVAAKRQRNNMSSLVEWKGYVDSAGTKDANLEDFSGT